MAGRGLGFVRKLTLLIRCGICCAALSGGPAAISATRPPDLDAPAAAVRPLRRVDIDLLDDLSRRSFRYFWEQTDVNTGLVMDRALARGSHGGRPDRQGVASIAATGFGLAGWCVAAEHHWISHEIARQRVLAALRLFTYTTPQQHGWFYHYLDPETGARAWQSEVSSIDTALLLAGVLTARECFHNDPDIVDLATNIYNRVDFPWMMDGSQMYFSHGWTQEKGFLRYRWNTYSELLILYVLGIGSPTHPISPRTWDAWRLPIVGVGGYTYVGGGPLFIHQYSLAWIDLRDRFAEEPPAANPTVVRLDSLLPRRNYHLNYFANSVVATRAQQELFSKQLSREFSGYSRNVWGVTASDSTKGYTDWGASPTDGRIDGTVVPSAAAGSLMFTPDICIPAMRTMLVRYGTKVYGRYGFVDAFNPMTGWVSRYVIGIDMGITLLSAENLRTGSVWQWFMNNPEPERALDLVGLLSIRHPLENYQIPPSLLNSQPSQKDFVLRLGQAGK